MVGTPTARARPPTRIAAPLHELLIAAVGHKDAGLGGERMLPKTIKRMPRERLSVQEIKPDRVAARPREQLTGAEKSRIQPVIAGCSQIVALDERGKDLSTQQLAQRLEHWMREGGDTAFLIGGADGLDPN